MDEFQSPKATRKYPIQRNLAEQPDSLDDLADDLGDSTAADDMTVVELPGRSPQLDQISEAPPTRRSGTKRKSSSAAKRKTQPTAVQKTPPSFRQFQDMQQPFAEELRRLEAQAERINQLLIERANRRMQFEQAVEQVNRSQEPPVKRRSPRPSPSIPSTSPEIDETETLRAQADRIKQRLAELEAAMQEAASSLYQLPEAEEEPVEEDWQLPISDTEQAPESVTSLSEGEPMQPEPTADLARPEQFPEREGPRAARSSHRPTTQRSLPWSQIFQLPKQPLDHLRNAAMWVAAAAGIRFSLRGLLISYPPLTPVVTLVMLVPAAIAVYLAIFVPRADSVSIYRLFLITLGFLLGGWL
jgi:hypothetical protein